MSFFASWRTLGAGGAVFVLAACAGGASQPPLRTPQQALLQPQSAARASLFDDRKPLAATSTARSIASVTSCTPVVTTAHGPMTAKLVPTKPVSHADVNASGCDIGIYLGPASNGQSIDLATVHDANQYGIYADQAQNVTIDDAAVWAIGNHDASGHFAPNGVQTGIGLYFSGASGSVDHTALFLYQKNGTAFNCLWNADFSVCVKPSHVSVQNSSATGLGTVNYIAQNGFQYWDSTAPLFAHNISSNNKYLNPSDPIYNKSATGYLFLCTNVASQQQLIRQDDAAFDNDINYDVTTDPTQC